LAVDASAARVGAVKATARPRATIADKSFFIAISPPFVGLPVWGSAFILNVQRPNGAEAKRRCGKTAHHLHRDGCPCRKPDPLTNEAESDDAAALCGIFAALSFPKIPSGVDSHTGQNHRILFSDVAILHALGIFVADLFKSRSRLEAANVFLRHQLNVALRRASRLLLRGSDRACWFLDRSALALPSWCGPGGSTRDDFACGLSRLAGTAACGA
jgi:hypothetical protein